ncbi:hypothetical protein R9X47_18710 [Wukongibacter baidiensis]|uniref:hypothetical protein n=1 Tax=Wukongibacter baidiensis TaxID=1723361 RepID=UPI003D7FAD99
MSPNRPNSNHDDDNDLYNDKADYYDDEYILEDLIDDISSEEVAAAVQNGKSADYDDKYILKRLMEGLSREELAQELGHKSYRTLDMYMRRRGYRWESVKQIYVLKSESNLMPIHSASTSKVQRVLALFAAGIDPREIAKRVGIKDHRTMAMYMKSKGYVWSSDKQNYILQKGEISIEETQDEEIYTEIPTKDVSSFEDDYSVNRPKYTPSSNTDLSKFDRLEKLIPMLEMIDRNRDKLIQLLAINEGGTIPRYVAGGVTITKSLCMSHPLAELVKEFSKEKNISQKEIFEVAIIEFLKKYGYDNEINALFTS